MESFFGKQYKLVSSENFDEYMKFIGKGYLERKAAGTQYPVICLERNNDGTYTFKMRALLASSNSTFTLDQVFDEVRADGAKVKSLVTIEDNIMIHKMKETNGRTTIHEREFYTDKVVAKITVEGWNQTARRTFLAQD